MRDRTGLADHRHADLPRIFQIVLDLAGDVLAQLNDLQIVDFIRLHDHPDLAAGLNRECLVDALKAVADILQSRYAFDIRLDALPPRARTRTADRVRRGHNNRLDRLRLDLAVMAWRCS